MNSLDIATPKKIVLNSEKFENAAEQFAVLSDEMSKFRRDISLLLEELEKGFDTPAGHRFINTCRKSLLQPIDDQAGVIRHVSDNLKTARSKYESVFTEFEALNNIIKKK